MEEQLKKNDPEEIWIDPIPADDPRRLEGWTFDHMQVWVRMFFESHDGNYHALVTEPREQRWGDENDAICMDEWLAYMCTSPYQNIVTALGQALVLSKADAMLFKMTWGEEVHEKPEWKKRC